MDEAKDLRVLLQRAIEKSNELVEQNARLVRKIDAIKEVERGCQGNCDSYGCNCMDKIEAILLAD